MALGALMFGFLQRAPLLDPSDIEWLHAHLAWFLSCFDRRVFSEQIQLVEPTPSHFPGKADSLHGMAELIFGQVQQHAGCAHWPCRLLPPQAFDPTTPRQVSLNGAIWGSGGQPSTGGDTLDFTYDPDLVAQPEALIASYAHAFAHHLSLMAPVPPPGGESARLRASEALAVYLGFGIMLANSSFNPRVGGCGKCHPAADRTSYLSELETTYALALFCSFKHLPTRLPLRHLKPALRPAFKRAIKEIARNTELITLSATNT